MDQGLNSPYAQIAKTFDRCWLDIDPTLVSDRYLSNIDPSVFAIWVGVSIVSTSEQIDLVITVSHCKLQ